jgi:two-component system, NarL family, invasion response regulator UvrY
MRALIVDDHEFTREGIIHILTDNFNIVKLARAGNYEDAMEQIQNNKWDIIILDINLPGKGGLEILSSIRATESKVPVLVLAWFLCRSMRAG